MCLLWPLCIWLNCSFKLECSCHLMICVTFHHSPATALDLKIPKVSCNCMKVLCSSLKLCKMDYMKCYLFFIYVTKQSRIIDIYEIFPKHLKNTLKVLWVLKCIFHYKILNLFYYVFYLYHLINKTLLILKSFCPFQATFIFIRLIRFYLYKILSYKLY